MTNDYQLFSDGSVQIGEQRYTRGHPRAKVIRSILQNRSAGEAPELERNPGNGTLGEVPVQKQLGRRFLISVTAVRSRLLDEDNLCEKYHVDLCRYAGIIPGDAPGQTKIQVRQRKADPGEQERVIIEAFYL